MNTASNLAVKLPRISLKLVREPRRKYGTVSITDPYEAADLFHFLRLEPEEIFAMVCLNARNEAYNYSEVSRGTVSASLVHPREVFKRAMLGNAHGILVAHNHPTGLTDPSPEDIQTTKQLIQAGRLLGINVVDHVIIGDRPYSFRENMAHLWND